jgi:hypothetical protein
MLIKARQKVDYHITISQIPFTLSQTSSIIGIYLCI